MCILVLFVIPIKNIYIYVSVASLVFMFLELLDVRVKIILSLDEKK